MDLNYRNTPGANVSATENGYLLTISRGDARSYRLAQIDDYAQFKRDKFPHRSSLSLSLRARTSAASLPGTWGFGLWNDPFGLSIGFGGRPFRLPALPNAVWFFHASEENYLSFGEKPGNGFLAQSFRSPVIRFSVSPLVRLARAGVTFPFSRRKAREEIGEIIEQDGVRLGVDETEWHGYRLEWSEKRTAFWVDDTLVLETPISPRPPLGLVIWIDNQYAAWRPDGSFGWGLLENKDAWLELAYISIS